MDLALGLGQQLLVADHDAALTERRHRVDPRTHRVRIDPLEEGRITLALDRRLVGLRGLLALDDLALDELPIGFERERDELGILGNRKPVPPPRRPYPRG